MSTTVLTSSSEKRLYEQELYDTVENESFWAAMASESTSSIVQVDNRPEKGNGARLDFALRPYLPPRSITNGPADGQERKLSYYYDNLTLDKHREAVISDNELQEIKAFFSITDSMEQFIKDWLPQIYDALHFKAVLDETNANNYYTGGKTAASSLVAGDTLDGDELVKLWTIAKTGNSRDFTPLKPYRMDGQEWLVYVTHPDVVADLRLSLEDKWKDALPRSYDNPLFRNADIVWSNIIVKGDRRVPITLGGSGGSVPVAKGILLGQQAIQQIVGKSFEINTGEKDYGDQMGYEANFVMGCKAPEFNSKRYGSVLVDQARSNISGDNNEAEINYTQIKTSNQ